MNSTIVLEKTDKGRAELRPGQRTLTQRERTLLLLADGKKSLGDLAGVLDGPSAQLIQGLLQQGFLSPAGPTMPAAPPEPAPAAVFDAPPTDDMKSLVGVRMFLFDLCERMFARRDPDLAEHLRERLRQAKDRIALFDVSDYIVSTVATTAGDERADYVRERIAALMPKDRAIV